MKSYINIRMSRKACVCIAVILALAGAFFLGTKVGASNGAPGSVSDPLITKSYLEERLAGGSEGSSFSAGYKKVSVKKGATLSCNYGAVIVLYKGSAKVSDAGSLINVTAGTVFNKGDTIAKYESYLIPESGCGVKAESDSIIFLLGEIKK